MLPERNSRLRRALVRLLAALVVGTASAALSPPAQAAPSGLVEQDITFSSGDLTLHGTVIAPDTDSPHPAMVMVHGSGRVSRDGYRQEAEAFARSGIVTLIYDKRPKRSKSDVDFELLADDALAALRALRTQPGVDPARTGLWGVSEGGWVAPIAAAESADVAFVVTVGAPGTAPERQQSWNLVNRLAAAGVSGSLVDTVSRTTLGLLVGAGLFPESGYDPAPVLARVTQPVLALWGDLDRVIPGAESLRVFQESLDRGGNGDYTLLSVPGADHTMRLSPDGFQRGDEIAPAYLARVASWVTGPRTAEVGTPPEQERLSTPVEPGSPAAQVVAVLVLLVAFAGYGLSAAVRRLRSTPPLRRPAGLLATTGLLSVLGLVGYLGHLASSGARSLGPVVLGRPLPWLGLQVLAVAVVVATAVTGVRVWQARADLTAGHRVRLGLLVAGGAVFVPWAVHWGLLVP
ncbi:alpha/beta hydrolase family protein [Saccharothrix luteola]|uniref:alpha/beta hydrolase family protein n=1 Tax=Saccharothrix luteola TaxID=2893018 RepID=UPI001E3ABA6C|nr:alpha/beta hydrolase [Saccharothrix luteola]MCC8244160.1 alpha/beta hydrolase [Saccharothrix luteola]MCC8250882.1 alpha/beta hydrolase [Saccharothrix luteola]